MQTPSETYFKSSEILSWCASFRVDTWGLIHSLENKKQPILGTGAATARMHKKLKNTAGEQVVGRWSHGQQQNWSPATLDLSAPCGRGGRQDGGFVATISPITLLMTTLPTFTTLFTAIVPAWPWYHYWVTVEHWHEDGNNDDNTPDIYNMSPINPINPISCDVQGDVLVKHPLFHISSATVKWRKWNNLIYNFKCV